MRSTTLLIAALFLTLPAFSAHANDYLPIPPAKIKESHQSKPIARRMPSSTSVEEAEAIAANKPDGDAKPWYRDAGEYISSRSVRMGFPTEVNSKILTDGKRFDVSLGKRVTLLSWSEVDMAEAWVLGVDGGMLASLERFSRSGQLTFATNTFDGYFGGFVGWAGNGWLALFRAAHLSAHLVDNAPGILNPVSYSQFWNEVIVGKTFPDPLKPSNWDLHLQGSLGLNHTSLPRNKQPRASFGVSGGWAPRGPNSLAILASADALRAGVEGQRPSYAFFLGIGTLNRPELTTRPFRIGITHLTGSDYRNQYYLNRHDWTALELSLEL